MADARFPGRWINDRRLMSLPTEHFRAFVVALAWSVDNRSDGMIDRADLDYIPRVSEENARALVTAEVWAEVPGGWLIVDYAGTQTTRSEFEVLENARRRDREKKARQRSKHDAVPRDVPGDMSPGVAQAGQDRQEGQARYESEASGDVDETTGEVLSWSVAVPGLPGEWIDPGTCVHGTTVGSRCRQCPGSRAVA